MISIPNPCSEDFDKMTPTERGAFCTKCSTDTFDFRNLSNTEIYKIFEDNKGQHICGRFTVNQLEDLNAGFLNWQNQSARTFQSKFLLACILAFGLGLFSCETEDQAVIETISTQMVIDDDQSQIAFINKHLETSDIDLLDYLTEEFEVIEPVECGIEMRGEVAIQEDIEIVQRPDYVLGGAIAYHDYEMISPEIIEEDTVEESILADPILADPDAFEAKAYPNPTRTNSTVALNITSEGQFDIMLYNMNGQLVNSIYSGRLTEGRQQFEIQMDQLKSGIYLVQVISQGQSETLKIQKVN